MISHSASHHAESNSTKILLFVPKPNLWMECILWRGSGGENSVWWCFFRKPERIERKNKSYTQCTGKYLILLLLAFLSVWCWHSKIRPKLWQHEQVEPQVDKANLPKGTVTITWSASIISPLLHSMVTGFFFFSVAFQWMQWTGWL